MNSTLIAFLALPLSVVAQNTDKPEWNNEYVSGVNKEVACQIAIPFANEQQAMDLAIEESPYYKTLNGTWKFHWVAILKTGRRIFIGRNMMSVGGMILKCLLLGR